MLRYLTDEELEVTSRFLFLSMAMVVIRQDIEHIQNGSFKIKEPYLKLIETMISEASVERRKIKMIMSQKSMQVVMLNKNDSFSSFLFLCQGREEKRNYFNPVIQKKVTAIVQELMFKALRPSQQKDADARI